MKQQDLSQSDQTYTENCTLGENCIVLTVDI